MKNPVHIAISKIKELVKSCKQIRDSRAHQVKYFNTWDEFTYDGTAYWYRYFKSKGFLESGKTFAIFSCLGPRYVIDCVKSDVKIFITGENLKRSDLSRYVDHSLRKPSIDLAMGFEVFEDPRYIRFPLWMDYMFPPESTESDIRAKCEFLRYPKVEGKTKFCSLVAMNAADGLREDMYKALTKIAHVDSAGQFLHNDDSLLEVYDDNKVEYMKQYVFNICPENTSSYGYTTEKLFEAISAGCVPVYWGAELADKAVINEDAIIRWNRRDKGEAAINQIKELWSNPKLMEEFLKQPRLLPTAEEYIMDTFATIENRLREIISRK